MKKRIFRIDTTCLALALSFLAINSHAQGINTWAGNGIAASTGDGMSPTAASFNNLGGVYYHTATGDFYVVEYTGCKIRKISSTGVVSTFAGTGVNGFGGDGGPATAAKFSYPIDFLADNSGNFYVIDNNNSRIRKIDAAGIITTFAGNGTFGFGGDGGPSTASVLNNPSRMTIDGAGNIYFADAGNNRIRKISASGTITTVAGNGTPAFAGDGGPATNGSFNAPLGVTLDGNGNMYIADGNNHRVRKVSTTGILSTFAGTGAVGYTGDGAAATAATMNYPNGITCDQTCNVYFTDWYGHKVRKINGLGIISTVVGTGVAGFSGDGGPALSGQLNGPNNLTFDPLGNLYIPEYYNNRVRKVSNLGESTGCPPLTPVAGFTAATSVCQDSCVIFSSTSTGSIDSVRWVSLSPGVVISLPTAYTTTICFPGSVFATVKLYVYGAGGVDSTSTTIAINAAPHPGITKSGHTLTATGGPYTGYQWYNGSVAITGATNATYTYTTPGGDYHVVVDSAGCAGTSSGVNTVGVAAVTENVKNYWIAQYNGSLITLRSSEYLDELVHITIYDATGRLILQDMWNSGSNSKDLNTSSIPSGLYIVRLSNQQTSVALRWTRQ